ncbi:hypothetical protein GCM10010449_08790 [Streptomyces rectiviolaceus]|uniref:Uncharacterized protein n=1 Tax=Streptomyces rectiviolaceus TaxID=332591 RepID=A0ABP6M7U3_9ACTN
MEFSHDGGGGRRVKPGGEPRGAKSAPLPNEPPPTLLRLTVRHAKTPVATASQSVGVPHNSACRITESCSARPLLDTEEKFNPHETFLSLARTTYLTEGVS